MANSKLVLAALAAQFFLTFCNGRPEYQERIPFGDFTGPTQNNALGHRGTITVFPNNQFGADFDDEGRSWTVAFCQMDSDGDGFSNGEELGDPNCTWTQGASLDGLCRRSDPSDINSVPNFNASCLKDEDVPLDVYIHMITMLLGWGFCAPIGISYAIKRDDGWFPNHQKYMAIAFALTAVGVITMFITRGLVLSSLHASIGMAAFVQSFWSTFLGVLRPHKNKEGEEKSKLRFLFEVVHPNLGRICFLTACVALGTGFPLGFDGDLAKIAGIVIGSLVGVSIVAVACYPYKQDESDEEIFKADESRFFYAMQSLSKSFRGTPSSSQLKSQNFDDM
mmetsp:Transcript_12289/g.15918  ORF Transcript_12289/g.15918 Transcript_12289/m.15918 type:complete len:336 (-) Transcript_12289:751-1758(-)|eukprot:CAMPEP_0184067556 /NCGR_PEP_ID=MMETSP0957-20130417/19648_1 /TAXON_ID=627963 /ORGANISM="Aplanochytrium sp, Strain PBS07" /LENGTH=335 /DNA_ID=CAMNT_0026365995 /DNA_START=46 /DNA_END=1053 /DNA_ORIENTATION=+